MAIDGTPKPVLSAVPVAQLVVDAVTQLHEALNRAYGDDYAYVVVVHGHVVASNSTQHGVVKPRTWKVGRS